MNTVPDAWQPAPDTLRERVVLVTGAGSGIGAAVSRLCAASGATVILTGKRVKPLEGVYDAIVEQSRPEPLILPLDLARATPEVIGELAEKIDSAFGRLDGLVHNAARFDALMPFRDIAPQHWAATLQVNVSAPYLMTRTLLPLLQASGDGRVVFSVERTAQVGRAHWGAYGVSKYALEGLFRTFADEMDGSAVTASAVYPGPTRTALRARAWGAEDPRNNPTADTRAPAYVYLLDPAERPPAGTTVAA